MQPTRPIAAAVVLALMVAGCSGAGTETQTAERPATSNPAGAPAGQAAAPAPAPAASAPAPAPATAPASDPAPAAKPAPVREDVDGGFRIGPFDLARVEQWSGPDRILGYFGSAPGTVALKGGLIDPFPVEGAYFSMQKNSPDLTRVVVYSKLGPDKLVDLSTGAGHVVEAPGYYGSMLVDAWSPDGRSYLVHAPLKHAVPGFFFLDAGGRVARTFHEPGFYSHRGVWSPDAKQVAFLSSPHRSPLP